MPELDLDRVELTIAGQAYGGWKSIDISIDLDTIASSFTLGVTERWAGQPERWAIEAGAEARVTIGGETVISGYVDRLDSNLSAEDHSIEVAGRSRAADLVDCAAVNKPGSWSGRKLEEIAAELAKPFGINIVAKTSTGAAFRKFALQPGETVQEALARMLKFRGLLAIATPAGDIEISAPSTAAPDFVLVEGIHAETIAGRHDVTDRFSHYIVKGQAAGDDTLHGKAASEPRAEAFDAAVKRYRPLIIVAEDQADAATLKKRAQWEATVRAAKAQEVTITHADWRDPAGDLWRFNQQVSIGAPSAWIEDDLLLAGVRFVIDEQGKRAELRLVPPEAYSQLAVPEHAEASKRIRKGRTPRRQKAAA